MRFVSLVCWLHCRTRLSCVARIRQSMSVLLLFGYIRTDCQAGSANSPAVEQRISRSDLLFHYKTRVVADITGQYVYYLCLQYREAQ